MTEQNDSINFPLDASYEASSPPFGVSFFLKKHLISHVKLFESSTFICNIYGHSSLQKDILAWIQSYLQKKTPKPLPLDLTSLSLFTQKGLKAIQAIPFGQTAPYQEVAIQAGNPKAARAIGGVCNRNPFPLIIPCHRVIGANQTLGGFAYNLNLKKIIIGFENCKIKFNYK